MAKKFTASVKQLKPDAKFNSRLVSKFINSMMWQGKKSVSTQIFYDAMDIVSGKVKDVAPLEIFETAINNVKPHLEVRSKRVGGASYQVPMPVNPKRQQSLAFRWILASARSKKGRAMHERLASELLDAFNKQGGAITTRENIHKMAEANKAFAHFAW
ncbi:MAG: 30S ribosomal protein S7 [Planctomycetes bacterium GWF2_41_51]|nr:MAG: 30S ribosomal protein S7 [Planctomycetes bacterium GWF2_41_51]HBG27773.1 30S ribosomal protein S7 [Phycisphaerales bacterium]